MKIVSRSAVDGFLSSRPEDPKNHRESNDQELRDIGVKKIKGLRGSFQARYE